MLTLVLAFTITLALATVSTAGRRDPMPTRIAHTILATWTCQDHLGVPRTHARSPWKPHTAGFRAAELQRWQQRWRRCTYQLHRQADRMRQLQTGIARYYRSQHVASGPMTGHEGELERAARRYGWSPFFLFATSVTESSGGLAACSSNHFNVWGLASCGTWNGTVPAVCCSWAEAFDYYARFLLGRVGVGSGWPHARTAYDFHGYAACSSCWGSKTASHMRRLFGSGPSVRYGR